MRNKTIPKPRKLETSSEIAKPSFLSPVSDSLTFSFAALERTEYFNLDGTCQNWSSDLFDTLKIVSTIPKCDLLSGKYGTLRVHNHENATPPNELPKGISLKDCYQIRISASKGGIHGVFSENVFYIVWLDPLHNMYPNEHFGGLRTVKPPSTCCKDRDCEIEQLKKKIEQLQEDCEFWQNEADRASSLEN